MAIRAILISNHIGDSPLGEADAILINKELRPWSQALELIRNFNCPSHFKF